jgi:hypothetical protein
MVSRRHPGADTLAMLSQKRNRARLGITAVEQTDTCRPDCAVGGVASREDQDPRAAQLIDKAVNLAVAPALGDANRLFRRPPFPPPAQRCALACVLSRAIRSGGSADPAQNAPIVLRLHATAIAWNKRLNPRPLPVAKPKQVRPHLLGPDSIDQPVESQHG